MPVTVACAFGVIFPKIISKTDVKELFPYVFSEEFRTSGLMFESFKPFWINSPGEPCNTGGLILFFMLLSSFSRTVYWRDYPFPSLGSQFSSNDLWVYFYASAILFCGIVWNQDMMPPGMFFSFLELLWLFGLFCDTNFRIFLFLWKNITERLTGNAWNL